VLRQGVRIIITGVKEQPYIFSLAVVGAAVYGGTTVAASWVLGWATDTVLIPAFRDGDTTTGALGGVFLAIVGVSLLKAAGIVVRRGAAGVVQYRLQASYRRRVTRQYLRLPLSWHQRHPTGALLSNANADVEAIWFPFAPLPMSLGVVVMLIVAAVAMALTDLVLAAVAFLIFPAIFGLNVYYQRRLTPIATRAQQLRAEVSEVAHESFDGALVVKTLGREGAETHRFRARAEELRDAMVAVGRVRGLFDPALEALPNLGVLIVLLVGSARVSSGALAPGDLVQVAYLFTLLAFPVRAIGWVLGELPRSVVGWDRVAPVLAATGELPFGERALGAPGGDPARLLVRDVRYGYPVGADEPGTDVLHAVTLTVEPGQTVALVGPTGSGKSTLTTLLVRLVDPVSGAVLLDGVDLREVARGGVAAAAAVVPQQTFLFDDTVRGNVALGAEISDDAVWGALRLAQADGFVAALPEGIDTQVGERGTSLSGGQRQRIALARAVVRRPRLLVLDDATSAVDPRVEAAILAGLRENDTPTSVVVVAYRKATIALADEVVYIEHGRVLDRGTHLELLERSEGYRRLVNAYDDEAEGRAAAAAAAIDFGQSQVRA